MLQQVERKNSVAGGLRTVNSSNNLVSFYIAISDCTGVMPGSSVVEATFFFLIEG